MAKEFIWVPFNDTVCVGPVVTLLAAILPCSAGAVYVSPVLFGLGKAGVSKFVTDPPKKHPLAEDVFAPVIEGLVLCDDKTVPVIIS